MGRSRAYSHCLWILLLLALPSAAQDLQGTEPVTPAPVAELSQPAPVTPAPEPMDPQDQAKMNEIAREMSKRDAGQPPLDETVALETEEQPDSLEESLSALRKWAVVTLLLVASLYIALQIVKRMARRGPLGAGPLGEVLGRMALDHKGNALHFVKVENDVLLLGVSPGGISLLKTYAVDELVEQEETPKKDAPKRRKEENTIPITPTGSSTFIDELRARSDAMTESRDDHDDMDSLRGDIRRLKEYLDEPLNDTPPR